MTNTTENITEFDQKPMESSQARVAAMMSLTPDQLRLIADWLVAEAHPATVADPNPCEPYDLASQYLVRELHEHADFKEGHLNAYSLRKTQDKFAHESTMSVS